VVFTHDGGGLDACMCMYMCMCMWVQVVAGSPGSCRDGRIN